MHRVSRARSVTAEAALAPASPPPGTRGARPGILLPGAPRSPLADGAVGRAGLLIERSAAGADPLVIQGLACRIDPARPTPTA